MVDVRAASIPRQKPLSDPLLEKYVFIPNETRLTTEDSIRVNMQLILENEQVLNVKTVELFDDNRIDELEPLSSFISDAFECQPLIKADVTVLSQKLAEVRNANVKAHKLSAVENDYLLIVANGLLGNPNVI